MNTVGTGTLAQRWHDRPNAVDLDPDAVFAALLTVSERPEIGVAIDIVHDEADPLITVTEDDRSTQIRFTALVSRLNRSGTRDSTAAITAAIRDWVDTRPVSDAAAAERGVATIVRYGNSARWQVTVARPSGALAAWVPGLTSPTALTRSVREDAMRRAASLTVTPLRSGRVTVWSYLPEPRLSASVLSQPDALHAVTPSADATIVLTPGRPLAVADHEAATRLVAEVNQPHLMFPLNDLAALGWM